MTIIHTVEELDALYDVPVTTSIIKEVDHLTPLHREYVDASPFVLIASSGPAGLDCSPRGDPAVRQRPGQERVRGPAEWQVSAPVFRSFRSVRTRSR